jgi:hypothetical protein
MWHRSQLAFGTAFALSAFCALDCSSDKSPQPASSGAAGSSGGGASGVSGAPGAAGGAAAGASGANVGGASVGGAGASSFAGSANNAGAGGVAGVAGVAGSTAAAGAGGGSGSFCNARPGLLFCDDFEKGTVGGLPAAPWSGGMTGDAGTVTFDDSVPAHSGSKTVHVHGDGFQTLLTYHDPAVLPQASGRFYVRAFVSLGAPMVAGHNTFVIADLFASPGTGNALRLGEQNSMLMMTVGGDAHGYLSNQNYYNDGKPGVVLKNGAYSCLELLLDSPNTEIEVWVDGVDVPDLHVTNLAHENYDELRFGFEQYAGPVSDFWYDDIAVGSARIGCD